MKRILIALILASATLALAGPDLWMTMARQRAAYWPDSILTGLVSYWTLEENAANTFVSDSHGNNNGVASKNTSLLSAPGKVGNAFEVAGDSVSVANDASLMFGTGAMTITAWIKTGAPGIIVNKYAATGGGGQYTFQIDADSKAIRGHVWKTGFGVNIIGVTDITTTNWYHVAFVVDSGGKSGRVYVNGVVDKEGTATTGRDSNSDGAFTIGKDTGSGIFNGKLDEVGVWGRGLTTSEIQWLFNNGKGRKYR